MIKMSKFLIGIRPATKMFRLSALSGIVVDEILAARGKKPLCDEYYKQVYTAFQNAGDVRMSNEDSSNVLIMNWSDILFTKEAVNKVNTININNSLEEFEKIWNIIDDVLKIRDVRRIGIFAEHVAISGLDNPSMKLLCNLANMNNIKHPAKFSLSYEERKPTIEGMAPDIEKNDLINIMRSYYDGETDATHPIKRSIKADLDVQRYFAPLISSVVSEVSRLMKIFIQEQRKLENFLQEKGIVGDEKT